MHDFMLHFVVLYNLILHYTLCQTYAHLVFQYTHLGFPFSEDHTNKLLVKASNLSLTDHVGNQEYVQFLFEHL